VIRAEQDLPGIEGWGEGWGGEQHGEMTQTMYAHGINEQQQKKKLIA
jgi:hypothetical protein